VSNHYQQPTEPGGPWPEDRPAGTSWSLWAIVAIIVIAIGLGAAFLVGQGAGDPAEEVALADVADDTSEPETEGSVVVEGEVDEFLTDRAMTLTDPQADEPLLVLVRQTAMINGIGYPGGMVPIDQIVPPERPVEILGTVQTFDRERTAEELGIVLNEELFDTWEGRRVLLADRLDSVVDATALPPGEPSE
jgi:hypothetical protein